MLVSKLRTTTGESMSVLEIKISDHSAEALGIPNPKKTKMLKARFIPEHKVKEAIKKAFEDRDGFLARDTKERLLQELQIQ